MNLIMRSVREADEAFLYQLYCSTRTDELALANWTNSQQQLFLQMQFTAQRSHYTTYYPQATHNIIYFQKQAVGRLMVDRSPSNIHLIDITILPEYCGKGIGTQLLKQLLTEGTTARKPVTLQVFKANQGALQLYKRLGFVVTGEVGTHFQMQVSPNS
jgi:ribosomal protein S18 acetylase RimI-like enzyme